MLLPPDPAMRELLDRFQSIVKTDPETLHLYSFDGLRIPHKPAAVVFPEKPEQIGTVLKIANKYKIPITTRGAGSTLTGGATPVKGGWVIDTKKLNRIEIDKELRVATVGCGAIVANIQDEARNHGLFYPPDPSSYQHCTIGGNIACNAGGLRCVKYGVTRDYILSLKGYLASGEFVEWAKPVRKFATGYNIRDLWIGSEGTLGVVTEASLKLIPLPETQKTLLCGFDNEARALTSVLDLLSTGVTPSILEFVDKLSVKGAQETVGGSFFDELDDPAIVLLEVDGDVAQVEQQLQIARDWAEKYSDAFTVAANEIEAEHLWTVRRKCSGAMYALGDTKLNEDVVVPLSEMPVLLETIDTLREQSRVPIAVFGHAGDGNLHVNIMYNHQDTDMVENAKDALDRLMKKVVELNGAISGEHGIGLAKSHYIGLQFNEQTLQLMQSIKQVFDPNNILNPGKIFEAYSPWDHLKIEHKFPWDKAK